MVKVDWDGEGQIAEWELIRLLVMTDPAIGPIIARVLPCKFAREHMPTVDDLAVGFFAEPGAPPAKGGVAQDEMITGGGERHILDIRGAGGERRIGQALEVGPAVFDIVGD